MSTLKGKTYLSLNLEKYKVHNCIKVIYSCMAFALRSKTAKRKEKKKIIVIID